MANIFTGAQAIIKYEGFPIAYISSINVRYENRLGEIPKLDSIEVGEYAERGHRCSFTITKYKLAPGAAQILNIPGEDAADLGLDNLILKEILLQPANIVEVYDTGTKIPVFEMQGVKFEGGTGQLDARGIWIGTWNFKATRGRGI